MSSDSLTSRSPWVQRVLADIFPRLRAWPLSDWPRVLARARKTRYDILEKIGTLGSVLITLSLIRPVRSADLSAVLDFFAQFALVASVFLIAIGPFYLRRIRRGIELAAHDDGVLRAGEPAGRA